MQELSYADYDHRVLIVLVGTAPAVVTETLWALAQPGPQQFVPTKVVLITTTAGREALNETLFAARFNQIKLGAKVKVDRIQRMAQALGITLPLSASDIVVPRLEEDDTEVEDAHSAAELGVLGDAMFSAVQAHAFDDGSAIVFSLSGGRKGMANLAGQCMSALARPQDRLVHVAVEPAWIEKAGQDIEFYYPGEWGRSLSWTDGKGTAYEAADDTTANVTIAVNDEPFFRLRPTLSALGNKREPMQNASFVDLLRFLEDSEPKVRFEVSNTGDLWINGLFCEYWKKCLNARARAIVMALARGETFSVPPEPRRYLELMKEAQAIARESPMDSVELATELDAYLRRRDERVARPTSVDLSKYDEISKHYHLEPRSEILSGRLPDKTAGESRLASEFFAIEKAIQLALPPLLQGRKEYSLKTGIPGKRRLPEVFEVIMKRP